MTNYPKWAWSLQSRDPFLGRIAVLHTSAYCHTHTHTQLAWSAVCLSVCLSHS